MISKWVKEEEFDYEKYEGKEDLLDWFVAWYLGRAIHAKCLPLKTVQDNCLYSMPDSHVSDGFLAGLTLYRQGSLQVQLFMMSPNSKVPMHTHPNMDSYEAYVGGEPLFVIEGQDGKDLYSFLPESNEKLKNFDNLENKESFYKDIFLKRFRITKDTLHGGEFGKKGGAFLSIQHWKNNLEPTSPVDDWHGDE